MELVTGFVWLLICIGAIIALADWFDKSTK